MMIDDLLARVDRPRKTTRGWEARCPAHPDKNPSLSVREGDLGILIKCWAGCTVEEICAALGIQVKDLFFDTMGDVQTRHEVTRQAQARKQRRVTVERVKETQADLLREAEAVVQAATGVDISRWSDEELDRAMNDVCRARALLIQEERAEWMTD